MEKRQSLFICTYMITALALCSVSYAGTGDGKTVLSSSESTLSEKNPQAVEEVVESRVLPWIGIQAVGGDRYGSDDGYLVFEGFLPIFQSRRHLFFGNARGILGSNNFDFDDDDDDSGDDDEDDFSSVFFHHRDDDDILLSANAGAGYRYYHERSDRIWGANAFYDFRDTGLSEFHQVGIGIESLGKFVDFRANGYIPVGDDRNEIGAAFFNPVFVGNIIQLDRTGFNEVALTGFDAELGVAVAPRIGLKVHAGPYYYQFPCNNAEFGASPSDDIWGVKGRLEERFTDDLDVSVSVAHDEHFGTSAWLSVGYRFGGGASKKGASRSITYARRADRIERNHQIVVTQQRLFTDEAATDQLTGEPIEVVHVASYAAPGGDGTAENPYMTLPEAEGGSDPSDLIFAWADSVFNNQSISLQESQRFLGEGIDHFFFSSEGMFLLPRATMFGGQPQIVDAMGNAVTLADNNEVSGFIILSAGANGIFGDGSSNPNINRNSILSSVQNGIFLDNFDGGGLIQENTISDNGIGSDANSTSPSTNPSGPAAAAASSTGFDGNFNGILINAATFSATISDNVITGNGRGGDADSIATADGGGATGAAAAAAAATGGDGNGNGILINATEIAGQITGNTVTGNGVGGTATSSATATAGGVGPSAASFSVTGASASAASSSAAAAAASAGGSGNGSGILLNAGTLFSGTVSGNTLTDNGRGGDGDASAAADGSGGGVATASATIVTPPGGAGSSSTNSNPPAGAAAAAAAVGGSGTGDGIVINAPSNTGTVSGNTETGNGNGGTASSSSSTAGP